MISINDIDKPFIDKLFEKQMEYGVKIRMALLDLLLSR